MNAPGNALSTVGVVGVGLIGGSLARHLHDLGLDVVVFDPDPATRDAAAAAGLRVADLETVVACDVVVLASPLDAMGPVMVAAAAGPAPVVIDVGSVKVAPAAAARAAGLADRYVGCHPMNGTELSGFTHADPALLSGITWAVAFPDPAAAPLLGPVVEWLLDTFEATVLVLSAAQHDDAVALTSHAPHVLAHLLLANLMDSPDAAVARHLVAGSFRDGTRVAGRNPTRTLNLLRDNAVAVRRALADLAERLDDLVRILNDDPELVREELEAVARDDPAVREPVVVWQPVSDLDALLAQHSSDQTAVLLRGRPGRLEWAEP